MANIKSAKKRAKTNEIRRQRNVARMSDLRTATKKVISAIKNNNLEEARTLFIDAQSKISRAYNKGLLKKNTVARKVSLLAKKLKIATATGT